MTKIVSVFAITVLIATLGTGMAFAQSSGNFSATGSGLSCVIGTGGVLSGASLLRQRYSARTSRRRMQTA